MKNYVENIFLPYEVNENSTRLKNDILSHMEDEYYDLKENGISEEESIGTIISKFGSFEDLLSELNLKSNFNNQELSEEDFDMVEKYKKFSSIFPALISAGVVFCIMAVAISGAVSYFSIHFLVPIVFFSMIAIGVTFFIMAGVKKDFYISYFKSKNLTQYYDVEEHGLPINVNNPKHRKNKLLSDSIQGIMWLAIIAIYLFLGFVKGLWHPGWIIFVIGGITSGIIEIIFNYINSK